MRTMPRAGSAVAVLWLALSLGAGCSHHPPARPYVPPALPPTVPPPLEPTDVLQLNDLTAGALVTSPLVIHGSARGPWYFEASFPVRLVDETGRELAHAAAHAQGDWTSEQFTPFTVALFFEVPAGVTTGSLVFQSDNPSGIREQQREKRVPVRFVPASPR